MLLTSTPGARSHPSPGQDGETKNIELFANAADPSPTGEEMWTSEVTPVGVTQTAATASRTTHTYLTDSTLSDTEFTYNGTDYTVASISAGYTDAGATLTLTIGELPFDNATLRVGGRDFAFNSAYTPMVTTLGPGSSRSRSSPARRPRSASTPMVLPPIINEDNPLSIQLTVGEHTQGADKHLGHHDQGGSMVGSLSATQFRYEGLDYQIEQIHAQDTGGYTVYMTVDADRRLPDGLTFSTGVHRFSVDNSTYNEQDSSHRWTLERYESLGWSNGRLVDIRIAPTSHTSKDTGAFRPVWTTTITVGEHSTDPSQVFLGARRDGIVTTGSMDGDDNLFWVGEGYEPHITGLFLDRAVPVSNPTIVNRERLCLSMDSAGPPLADYEGTFTIEGAYYDIADEHWDEALKAYCWTTVASPAVITEATQWAVGDTVSAGCRFTRPSCCNQPARRTRTPTPSTPR